MNFWVCQLENWWDGCCSDLRETWDGGQGAMENPAFENMVGNEENAGEKHFLHFTPFFFSFCRRQLLSFEPCLIWQPVKSKKQGDHGKSCF